MKIQSTLGLIIVLLLVAQGSGASSTKEAIVSSKALQALSSQQVAAAKGCYRTWQAKQPALSQLVQSAYAQVKLSFAPMDRLQHDLKRAAWLPKVSVGYDLDFDQKNAIAIEDTVSVSSGDVTVGPPESQEDYSIGQWQSVGIKLAWDLAPLFYHRDQIVMGREQLSIAELRLKLADKLAEIYRRREFAAFEGCVAQTPIESLSAAAKLDGVTAELESLSGQFIATCRGITCEP